MGRPTPFQTTIQIDGSKLEPSPTLTLADGE
jgi:hypothetical protein